MQKGPEARLHLVTLSFAHLEPGGSHREDAQATSLVSISVWLVTVPSNATRSLGGSSSKAPCSVLWALAAHCPCLHSTSAVQKMVSRWKEGVGEAWEGQAGEGHQGRPVPWSALQMGGASKGQDDWHPVVKEKVVRSVTMASLEPPAGHELFR